jgi:hypothetical protein
MTTPEATVSRGRQSERLPLLTAAITSLTGFLLYTASFVAFFDAGLTEREWVAATILYLATASAVTCAATAPFALPRVPGVLSSALIIALAVRPIWRYWSISTGDYLAETMYALIPPAPVLLVLTVWFWNRRARLSLRPPTDQ